MNGESSNQEGVRAVLAETALSLSEDQIRRLSAGESVELDEGATTAAEGGRCGGIKIFCKKAGPVTCCVYLSWQGGKPKVCVDCH